MSLEEFALIICFLLSKSITEHTIDSKNRSERITRTVIVTPSYFDYISFGEKTLLKVKGSLKYSSNEPMTY